MPRHVNPTDPKRTATAPYNFVALPQHVFEVADGIEVHGEKIKPWELHDRFVPGTYRGWIDLEIETLTPLFIRGSVTKRSGEWDERPSRLRPEHYMTPDGRAAIPGSSLRGMVRTLVEILSFSKIEPVTRSRPFFRTVSPDRLGRAYGEHMRRGSGVGGGVLRKQGSTWVIEPCDIARVARDTLSSRVRFDARPDYTPPWPPQHEQCWVTLDTQSVHVTRIEFRADRPDSKNSWRRGVLVLTGNSPGKRREFVFLEPAEPPAAVQVPPHIWDRFHDDDQITQWQQRAFPKGKPSGAYRKADGHLRDGEPVFYLLDEDSKSEDNPDGLVFLGRARMFRLPYDRGPSELIPTELGNASLDLAQAMFGMVGYTALKSRLSFEDAVAEGEGSDSFEEIVVPRILSAPKPTTFPHYLTQDGTSGKDGLTTYLVGDRTTLRGHKLYWHRWDGRRDLSQVKEAPADHDRLLRDLREANPSDTQHTVIRPVRPGVTFTGRIRFENLTAIELGAVLCALDLPAGCCHRLGMGKPLGLGSVRISSRLTLIDNSAHYRAWRSDGSLRRDSGAEFREAFQHAILAHAQGSGETLLPDRDGLRRIARLDALFQLLTWDERPDSRSTEYMALEQFRDRPVLPTPHVVRNVPEPNWPEDRPRAAGDGDPRRSPAGGRSRSGRPRPEQPRGADRRTPRLPRPRVTPKPVQKGQTRKGTLKREASGWKAVFEGDEREAEIVNPDRIPADCTDRTAGEFYIIEQSKAAGIKCRFERLLDARRRGP